MTSYLELADYLLIAEAVLGIPAEIISKFDRIGLAESALRQSRQRSALQSGGLFSSH